MRRVEDVLGRGWENHVEGQKLKSDGDSFRMKLNTQEIFDDWARKVISKDPHSHTGVLSQSADAQNSPPLYYTIIFRY